jgi:1,4-dihydroxy-2-naphthoate octaprenyltransferase
VPKAKQQRIVPLGKQKPLDPNKVEKNEFPARLNADERIPGPEVARPKVVPPSAKRGQSRRPGGRPPSAPKIKKATARDWIAGARIRTLPLSVAPVLLGTAAAHTDLKANQWNWGLALLALAVAVFLQIGVNYANDYSDGIRGTDKYRVGPSRLTGSGAAKPRTVFAVAMTFFALAAAAGIVIVVITGLYWLLAVGAVCIVAAYFYTGGKRPYGYYGLGEIFVFVFFGLVATIGTTYILEYMVNRHPNIDLTTWIAAVSIGLIACAVLMVNNIRDLPQDKLAKKRTLAVLIGNKAARITYVVMLLLPFVGLAYYTLAFTNAYLGYLVLFLAIPASIITLTAKTPRELITALQLTSATALFFSIALGFALAF